MYEEEYRSDDLTTFMLRSLKNNSGRENKIEIEIRIEEQNEESELENFLSQLEFFFKDKKWNQGDYDIWISNYGQVTVELTLPFLKFVVDHELKITIDTND